ncbi:uncharacterized protein LOC111301358 [Durio zibethinus]|uniref:Uncharacterized protein LOC111301358 n=1 Tax=Durio zibethinus TaxID=66656 RepID=A0A6P5ZJW8_DURZI|nr:uncharacterized protein LOC111301358 [Durio zibethinus]XP_022752692.1 uncharacterized protein LOC111301358 [Durio zibethinus]XP_022752694.1 uncharacterized protein LOC111301358 [Durio zibethinus]XP_022752695.1 uncharacterized protein LOC111301358 [Durio zibethinus]XP_022752696.1 uncharacterized protein LOC111301358 [Durio zibethinus]XP_022752697.1 uncharacterized protein LOC111301358 [Durio zibethinus]XP_022752698.1 uncharacterized protein LOC111301358 [Durio zibethinus]XP_022752699.1 unc
MFPLKYFFSPPPSSAPSPRTTSVQRRVSTTTIHIMALDGLVNVNSLFTFALFLGLAWYPTPTLIDDSFSACAAGSNVAERLVAYHVYSFSSFLFSSLIASTIKQAIKISKDSKDVKGHGVGATLVDVNLMALRVGMLVSGVGSVFGCVFLMMALVAMVEIKLGTLSCGSLYSFAAIGPLVVLVPLALVIYVCLVIYAFTR